MNISRHFPVAIAAIMLVGCATTVPEAIREVPAGPSPVEVRGDPEQFTGSRVRWGGTITNVRNREAETWIEVVARPLEDNGRPEEGDVSFGRFLARLKGFSDPAIYSEGREITVVGTLAEPVTQQIGEYPYRYPVVDVASHHLWPVQPRAPAYYYDPYWYDPWYDPWYPFSPWPYYRHPYYW